MTKKLFALLLAVLMLIGLMTGCQRVEDVWVSVSGEYVDVAGDNDDADVDADDDDDNDTNDDDTGSKKTSRTKKKTSKSAVKTTIGGFGGATVTRKAPTGKNALVFTPVADKGANYDVKGTVSVAIDTVRPTDYTAMFDVMQKMYPNIKIMYDYWAHSASDTAEEYLAKTSQTGTMANIIWDDAGILPTHIRNGWVYPITDMVAKDPEYANVPANLKDDYTFGGEVYALPHQACFLTFVFNTTLLKKLNLKMPKTEWSLEDFEGYLKEAGTNGYNQNLCVGTELINQDYAIHYMGTKWETGKTYGFWGYCYEDRVFDGDLNGAGLDKMRFWRTQCGAGAESWYVYSQKNSQGDLLSQKFGVTNYQHAFQQGKALIKQAVTTHIYRGDLGNNLNFDYEIWTSPNVDGNLLMHVDHCFLTTTVNKDNLQAAFQMLRFMTYSTNGNLARLQQYEKSEAGKYVLNSPIYHPTTTNATVIKKFNGLAAATEADKYFVANVKNSSRNDTKKIVPLADYSFMTADIQKVTDGQEPGSYVKSAFAKLNTKQTEEWAAFEAELKQVQKEFKPVG